MTYNYHHYHSYSSGPHENTGVFKEPIKLHNSIHLGYTLCLPFVLFSFIVHFSISQQSGYKLHFCIFALVSSYKGKAYRSVGMSSLEFKCLKCGINNIIILFRKYLTYKHYMKQFSISIIVTFFAFLRPSNLCMASYMKITCLI